MHRYAQNNGWGFLRSLAYEGDLFFHIDNLMPRISNYAPSVGEEAEFMMFVALEIPGLAKNPEHNYNMTRHDSRNMKKR